MPRTKKIDPNLSIEERLANIKFAKRVDENYRSDKLKFIDKKCELSFKLKELAPMIVDDILSNLVSKISHKIDLDKETLTLKELEIVSFVIQAGVNEKLIKPVFIA